MPNTKKCQNCGNLIPVDLKQCPHCGWMIEEEDDFVLPSLDHPKQVKEPVKSVEVEPMHSVTPDAEETVALTHTFTALDLDAIPVEESENETKLKESIKAGEDFILPPSMDMEEPPVVVKEKKTGKKKKKKKNIAGTIFAVLGFVVLTLALFIGGVFAVDSITGGDFRSTIGGLFGRETVVTPTIEPTAEPTVEPSVEPTAEPEETVIPEVVHPEGSLGHLVITEDQTYVQYEPTLSASVALYAQNGQEYEVYEITQADGYTWYRVGDSLWISSDGTGMTYTQY